MGAANVLSNPHHLVFPGRIYFVIAKLKPILVKPGIKIGISFKCSIFSQALRMLAALYLQFHDNSSNSE
ncbi:MAG: hypothetical protein CM15mP22_8090 [Gammaproteobacteria bacterium]|nr:MAG: hypothetical protein CM15mP22_8090 [Gammaproteobacteria bacterium]